MDSDIGGQVHGISLDSFLQMVQIEKTTCTLTVKFEDQIGYLYILQGNLIAAEVGDLVNVEAACKIISWDKSTIEVENSCSKTEDEINQPLMNILMEGLKLRDEAILEQRGKKKPDAEKPAKTRDKPAVPTPPPDDPQADAIPELHMADAEAEAVPELPVEEPVADVVVKESAPKYRKIAKKKKPEDVAKALKRKRMIVLSAAAAALIAVAIGAVISIQKVKAKRAEKEFQSVLTQVNSRQKLEEKVTILKNFIDSHEPGAFVEEAESRLKQIDKRIQDREYKEVARVVDGLPLNDAYKDKAMAAYNGYLKKFPTGVHTAKIREGMSKIPGIVDDINFKKIKAVEGSGVDARVAACRYYLDNHPKGKHVKTVQKLVSDMSETFYRDLKKELAVCETRKNWEGCIGLCDFFISNFKKHRRWDDVVVIRNEIQAKIDLVALAENAKSKGNDYEAAKSVYVTYLEEYPDAYEKEQIIKEIEKIDRKLAEKGEWEKVAALSKNREYTIFDRKQALKRYISRHPLGVFVEDAEKMLKALEAKTQAAGRGRQNDAGPSGRLSSTQTGSGGSGINAERIRREREKVRAQLKGISRYTANGDGTFTDSITGLMWSILDSRSELGKCLDYESARKYVKGVTTGGYRDWRMPDAGDLAGLYKNPPFFPASMATWYWTSRLVVDGYHRKAGIVTSKRETVFKRKYADVDQCGAVRAVRP